MNVDLKGIYGCGWAFPVDFTVAEGVVMATDQEDIAQSLQILFSTQPGERIMRADYGCDMQSFVFENISEPLLAEMRTRIADSLLRHEPRVAIEEVQITRDERHRTMLRISVGYQIRGTRGLYRLDGWLDMDGANQGGFA